MQNYDLISHYLSNFMSGSEPPLLAGSARQIASNLPILDEIVQNAAANIDPKSISLPLVLIFGLLSLYYS